MVAALVVVAVAVGVGGVAIVRNEDGGRVVGAEPRRAGGEEVSPRGGDARGRAPLEEPSAGVSAAHGPKGNGKPRVEEPGTKAPRPNPYPAPPKR